MLTMVGLGPPLESAAAHEGVLADALPASEERTLVGFPPAPRPFDAAELEDATSDEVTLVASYDEITVVRKAPVRLRPCAEPAELLDAVEPSAPRASEGDVLEALLAPEADAPEADAPEAILAAEAEALEAILEPEADVLSSPQGPEVAAAHALLVPQADAPNSSPPDGAAETDGVVVLDAAELVELDPDVKIFPPSLESFVPPKRSSRTGLVALIAATLVLGPCALAWIVVTPRAPVTQSEREKIATLANDQASTDARARAVARALEASVAEWPPADEVVSVHDLSVKSGASRTELASSPKPPFVPFDLDPSSDEPAVERSTLTITSTPPSNVVLDGRPLGLTPHELGVSPGPHSVVFIHPVKGRKSLRVEATAGKPAVATVSF
jgi:hypothetical protein